MDIDRAYGTRYKLVSCQDPSRPSTARGTNQTLRVVENAYNAHRHIIFADI